MWVRPREGGAQFDQLCDVMWNCALFAFNLLPREQCIAHLENDMTAMCSEQGVYFQEGVVSDIAIESGIMLVSTQRPMVLTSPTLLPFSSRILEMIVLNFTDDGSSSVTLDGTAMPPLYKGKMGELSD